jgi:hypothetical protein
MRGSSSGADVDGALVATLAPGAAGRSVKPRPCPLSRSALDRSSGRTALPTCRPSSLTVQLAPRQDEMVYDGVGAVHSLDGGWRDGPRGDHGSVEGRGESEFEARPLGPPAPQNFCPASPAFAARYPYLFPAHRDQEKNKKKREDPLTWQDVRGAMAKRLAELEERRFNWPSMCTLRPAQYAARQGPRRRRRTRRVVERGGLTPWEWRLSRCDTSRPSKNAPDSIGRRWNGSANRIGAWCLPRQRRAMGRRTPRGSRHRPLRAIAGSSRPRAREGHNGYLSVFEPAPGGVVRPSQLLRFPFPSSL